MARLRKSGSLVIAVFSAALAVAACEPGAGGSAPGAISGTRSVSAQSISSDIRAGERALAGGDLRGAERAFTTAMRRAPSDSRPVLGLAEVHLERGETDAAMRLFDALSRQRNSSARLSQGLGIVALRRGEIEEAKALLEKSVSRDSSLWRAWLALGRTYDRAGRPEEARRAFTSAEVHAPPRAGILNDIGVSYMRDAAPGQALSYFQRALERNPNDAVARGNLRIARAMLGDYDQAISGAAPQELADVLNNVGYAAILNRDFEIADQLLRRAVEISPTYHAAAAANLDLLAQSIATAATPALALNGKEQSDSAAPQVETDQPPQTDEVQNIAIAVQEALSETGDTMVVGDVPELIEQVGQAEVASRSEKRRFKWADPVEVIETADTAPPRSGLSSRTKGSADRTFAWADPAGGVQEAQSTKSVTGQTSRGLETDAETQSGDRPIRTDVASSPLRDLPTRTPERTSQSASQELLDQIETADNADAEERSFIWADPREIERLAQPFREDGDEVTMIKPNPVQKLSASSGIGEPSDTDDRADFRWVK